MRFSLFFVVFFFAICGKGEAQSAASPVLLLKWTPTALLDPQTPVFHFGLEVRPTPHWGLELAYGIPLAHSIYVDHQVYRNHRYEKWRGELRYLFNEFSKIQPFLALEGFYIPRCYERVSEDYETVDGEAIAFDTAQVQRNVVGGCLKWGGSVALAKRLRLEWYGGVGIRSRTIEYTRIVNPRPASEESFQEWFGPGAEHYEGHKNLPHFAMGVKLVFDLLQRKQE